MAQIFDDGSSLDTFGGVQYATDTRGDIVSGVDGTGKYYFQNDQLEEDKLQRFYPTTGAPWWENLAKYGATRAIDAAVGPKMQGSGGQQSTYAGQNGRTYVNGTSQAQQGGNDLLLIVGLGALLFFAMK